MTTLEIILLILCISYAFNPCLMFIYLAFEDKDIDYVWNALFWLLGILFTPFLIFLIFKRKKGPKNDKT